MPEVTQTTIWKIAHGGGANAATLKKLGDVLGVRASAVIAAGLAVSDKVIHMRNGVDDEGSP